MIIDQLREARLAQGITLKQLDELTGISYSRLSDIETGKANPSLAVLQRIAEALHVTITLQ